MLYWTVVWFKCFSNAWFKLTFKLCCGTNTLKLFTFRYLLFHF